MIRTQQNCVPHTTRAQRSRVPYAYGAGWGLEWSEAFPYRSNARMVRALPLTFPAGRRA